jgi:hypothetical protein
MKIEISKNQFISLFPYGIIMVYAISMLIIYFYKFHGPISSSKEDFGLFGDYIGGVLNPLISIITILYVIRSFKEQQSEKNDIVKLNRERELIEELRHFQKNLERFLDKKSSHLEYRIYENKVVMSAYLKWKILDEWNQSMPYSMEDFNFLKEYIEANFYNNYPLTQFNPEKIKAYINSPINKIQWIEYGFALQLCAEIKSLNPKSTALKIFDYKTSLYKALKMIDTK